MYFGFGSTSLQILRNVIIANKKFFNETAL